MSAPKTVSIQLDYPKVMREKYTSQKEVIRILRKQKCIGDDDIGGGDDNDDGCDDDNDDENNNNNNDFNQN